MLYIPNDPLTEFRHKHLKRGTEIPPRFTVSVNKETCPIHLSRESKMPFNRVWPGFQRPYNQTEQGEFVVFYGDEEVTVEVGLPENPDLLKEAILRPIHKGAKPVFKDGILSFTLKQNGYFSLECGDIHTSIQIFYCRPLTDDKGESATIRFDKGIHFTGKLNIKSGDKIYIHPEAVVFGSILGKNVENVTVYGGGVLDDSTEERIWENCYEDFSSGCIRFFGSKNIIINDIICLNASNWVLSTFNCSDVHIDGVKILGQWRYNTDGIDLVNAQHCSIRNCFVRSFDDTIVLKAIYHCPSVEDIVVEDCVLWCGWGKTLEIGLETSASEYKDIHYRNCDLIHNSVGAMAISNGNYALVHDVTYDSISIEYAKHETADVYQASDDMVFADTERERHADIFRVNNYRMWDCYPFTDIAGDKAKQYGLTKDISYRNIYVYSEDGTDRLHSDFCSFDPGVSVSGISIEGLYINGEKQTDLSKTNPTIQNSETPTVS